MTGLRAVAALAAGIVVCAAVVLAGTRALSSAPAATPAGPERPNLLAATPNPHRRQASRADLRALERLTRAGMRAVVRDEHVQPCVERASDYHETLGCYRAMTHHAPRVMGRLARAATRMIRRTRGACRRALVAYRDDERHFVRLLRGFREHLVAADARRMRVDADAFRRFAVLAGGDGRRADSACHLL